MAELGFSTQAFYKWAAAPICGRVFDDAHLTNAIVDIQADDPEFGYRLTAGELEAADHEVGEGRVHRLCREHKIWSTTTKKGRRSAGKNTGPAVHDDLVNRDFSAPAPDVTCLTDITEHPTAEGKLYCCAIKDCFEPDRGLCRGRSNGRNPGRARPALSGGPTPAERHPGGPFGQGSQFRSSAFTACSRPATSAARWAGCPRPATKRPWSPSTRCCRRTPSTSDAGGPATISPMRSPTGSIPPTTDVAVNDALGG